MRATTVLKNLINSKQFIIAPGVFDGLSARLVEQAGFTAIYASGGAIARSAGVPDIGLLSFTEVCERLAQIIDVVRIPVIADADTGFGGSANVARTVKTFERIGVAALHIEDQIFPKKCGHLSNKNLVSTEEMVQKIKIAKASITDPDFTLIARTDAIAVEGFAQAMTRATAYIQAGADMLFVEAPENLEQITAIAKLKIPKLINMFQGGKTPLIPTDQLAKLGYNLVIIPSDLQRSAIFAMQKTLQAIKQQGNSAQLAEQMVSFNEREKIIKTAEYLKLDAQFKLD